MLSSKEGFQGPVRPQLAQDVGARLRIISHPAFRLGFLDAQLGLPFSHDDIMTRIERETPIAALDRIRWSRQLFSAKMVERAQYRYEEGRLVVIKYGLRCKSWNQPDFPPKSVRDFARRRPDTEWL